VQNQFNYAPILEVVILFAGIFVTMVPALALLQSRGGELGLTRSVPGRDKPWRGADGSQHLHRQRSQFMVKAIAEQAGVRMPSFGGYAARAVVTLAPVYLLIAILLRHSG
jgi:Na+/H+ antiporter NhaD/arsenite permease-like protein